jgi:LacI family transcriptional regulator
MNIYDLAREAGVSIATASKALNGRRDVNEQTRQRVLEMAKKLNYHPSHLARGLARRRTENIGCVALRRFKLPFFTDPFYSHVLEGMETEVTARNYNLLLSVQPAEEATVMLQLPKLVREKNVDGLVLLGEMNSTLLQEVFERRIPCVIVDFFSPKLEAHYILSDNRGGERMLVKHLGDLKHKRIAFVQRSAQDYRFSERQTGFEQACAELKLQPQIWSVPNDGAGMDAELKQRLMAKDRPTAVVACNDEHALTVIRIAREVGLRVPQDLSVAGFDDIAAASFHQPGLTTIRVDKQQMGVKAIQTVFRLLEPPLEPGSRVELPVELVVRQSTGIAPE